jgi:hypothetical protein
MDFSNFIRIELTNQVFFKNEIPLENVDKLKFYKDDSSGSLKKNSDGPLMEVIGLHGKLLTNRMFLVYL